MWFHLLVLATSIIASTPTFVGAPLLFAEKFVLSPTSEDFPAEAAAIRALAITDRDSLASSRWIPHFVATASHLIAVVSRTLSWCIEASSSQTGAAVGVNHCTGAPTQKWEWLPMPGGRKNQIQLQGTDQCLGVSDKEGVLDGALIKLRTCVDAAAELRQTQSWNFDETFALPAQRPSRPLEVSSLSHAMIILFSMALLGGVILGASLGMRRSVSMKHCGPSLIEDQGGVDLTKPLATVASVEVNTWAMAPAVMTLNVDMDGDADARKELEGEPCNVVLTHANLAGAVALAKKWSIEDPQYPTFVVMPTGSNPEVKKYVQYHKHFFPIRGFPTIRAEDIRRVGIVDTQSTSRLGPAVAWLEHEPYTVVYDHHNVGESDHQNKGDIKTDERYIEPVGSVTTMIVEQLREVMEKQTPPMRLNEREATLFSLGIRWDTGHFVYPCTTLRDYQSVAYLVEQGSSQEAVAKFGQVRLSKEQRYVLARATLDLQQTTPEGIKVGVATIDAIEVPVGDLAAVAQALLERKSLDVMFLGVTSRAKGGANLSLIGRCSPRARSVKLDDIMQNWGGGGHAAAASASIKLHSRAEQSPGATANGSASPESIHPDEMEIDWSKKIGDEVDAIMHQVVERVTKQLPKQPSAREIMTTEVISCLPSDTFDDAMDKMDLARVKAIPVVDEGGKLMGMLKANQVWEAKLINEGKTLIGGSFLKADSVNVDTPFSEIEDLILNGKAGRLPVIDSDGVVQGIITRSDVVKHLQLYGDMDE